MQIAVVGPGAIGSTFAFQLSRAGHDVTAVARGARLERLRADRAIVDGGGERASVHVADALDPSIAFDLVIVTVLAPQVDAVLPALRASAARTILFMFNTFDALEPLSDAVGRERFAFGFPGGVFTLLVDGRIHPRIRSGTTVGEGRFAALFSEVGIPTVVDDDMQSWLRSHAAMVYPLMALGVSSLARGRGLTLGESLVHAEAFLAGMRIVRAVGSDVRPSIVRRAARLPRVVLGLVLWLASRTQMMRDLGKLGSAEPRMLADQMHAASPELAAPLLAIRP